MHAASSSLKNFSMTVLLWLYVQDLLTEEEEVELESEFENPEQESEEPLEPDLATELVDGIEHTDSYDLQQQQQQRNKEEATIKVIDTEDSLASLSCDQDSNVKQLKTSDDVEQSFNHTQQTQNKEDEVQTDSNDVTETDREETSSADTVNVGKRSASSEAIAGEGEEGKDSDSLAAEMIVAKQSTASDVVSQAMAKAVERIATPPV